MHCWRVPLRGYFFALNFDEVSQLAISKPDMYWSLQVEIITTLRHTRAECETLEPSLGRGVGNIRGVNAI